MARKSLLGRAEGARAAGARAGGYDRRRANKISMAIVAAVAVALAGYMAIELSTDPAFVRGGELHVRALFGYVLPLSEIRELSLEKSAVPLGRRVVGNEAFGLFREGDYEVGGLGLARVFLKRPDVSYVAIGTADRAFAISLGSLEKDQLLYDAIRLGMK